MTLLQHVVARLGLPEPIYRTVPPLPQPKLPPLHISPLTRYTKHTLCNEHFPFSPEDYPALSPLNPAMLNLMMPGFPRPPPLPPFVMPPPTLSSPTSPPVRLPSNFQPTRPPPTPLFIPPPQKVFSVGVIIGKGYPFFVAHASSSLEAKQSAAKQVKNVLFRIRKCLICRRSSTWLQRLRHWRPRKQGKRTPSWGTKTATATAASARSRRLWKMRSARTRPIAPNTK